MTIKQTPKAACFLVFFWAMISHTTEADVIVGQVDDFQDGTTMGWREGEISPNPPMHAANGGPLGALDSFLLNTSSGGNGPCTARRCRMT